MNTDKLIATLVDIKNISEKSRKEYESKGHRCPYASAIDSIIDRTNLILNQVLQERRIDETTKL